MKGSITDNLFFLLAVIVIGAFIFYRSRTRHKYPPLLPWIPVFGSLPFMAVTAAKMPRYFMEKSSSLGNVFAFYAGNKYAIVVNGNRAIQEALVKKSTDFAGRSAFYVWEKYVLKNPYRGISMRTYDEKFNRLHRQTLSILKDFGFGNFLMETRILTEVTELIKHIKEMRGSAFDPSKLIISSVMNIMYNITYGSRLAMMSAEMEDFVELLHNSFTTMVPEVDILPQLRFIPTFKRRMMAHVDAMKHLGEHVASDIRQTLDAEVVPDCFVRSFAEVDPDREEMMAICRDNLMAGAETSTNTIRWALVLLANHPEIQDRLHNEIDLVVGKGRLPALDDQPKMPYVEASVLELMRYKTVIPLGVPHLTTCDTELNGYYIPQDTMVIVNLYSAHMDPRVWMNPDTFRPERFLDTQGNVVAKDKVIPFSLGKRSCLGELLARQQIFLIVSGLLQQFDIRPPDGQQSIDCDEHLLLTLMPAPYQVRLVPRTLNM